MSKYAFKNQPKYVLSEESATEQVCRLLEYYDIDVTRLSSDDEKTASMLEKSLDAVRDNFRTGVLELVDSTNGKLHVTQRLSGGDTLTYVEVNSRAKLAMEKFDVNAGYSRIYAFMGSLCGVGKAGIEKLPARDLSVVETLGAVFSNA